MKHKVIVGRPLPPGWKPSENIMADGKPQFPESSKSSQIPTSFKLAYYMAALVVALYIFLSVRAYLLGAMA